MIGLPGLGSGLVGAFGGVGHLLAQAGEYHYTRPFVQPLYKAWDYWYLLLLPLCMAVAIVYKSIKCRTMGQVPREAAMTFFWIIGGIVLAGVVLAGVIRVL